MPTFAELKARFPNASLGFLAANASDGLPAELCPRKPDPAVVQVTVATSAKSKGNATRKPRVSRVQKTRNAGTWTEAEYWARVRSCLRRMSMFWKPARAALNAARFPCKGPNGQKWAYVCADCPGTFKRKDVQIDHIVPCGALTDYAHMGDFLQRLLPEDVGAYAIRCKSCHQQKTNAERVSPSGADDAAPTPETPATLSLP